MSDDKTSKNFLHNTNRRWSDELVAELDTSITNMAKRLYKTNYTQFELEDLTHEGWIKVIQIMDYKESINDPVSIGYLSIAAYNAMLYICKKQSDKNKIIHPTKSTYLNDTDVDSHGNSHMSVAKAATELEAIRVLNRLSLEESSVLRLMLEDLLDKLNENDRIERLAKNYIILKYVKNCAGDSEKINNMYYDLFNSLSEDKQKLINDISTQLSGKGLSNRDLWIILGFRCTDNITTPVRKYVKKILSNLKKDEIVDSSNLDLLLDIIN